MSLILVAYFLLYGLMHLYAYLKARRAYRFGTKTVTFLAIFILVMVFAPLIVRLSEKAGYENFARITAYAGYTWMAVLFLFFSVSLCIDCCRLCIYTVKHVFKKNLLSDVHAYKYFFIARFICSLSVVAYGYYEAEQIKTERLLIKTDKIPKATEKLKIVQISDIHLGLIVQKGKLEKIVNEIRKINPDILVATGDLVDGQINHLNEFIEPLKSIKPPYGKFAVTGNHEFYAGIEASLDFMTKAGFTVLRGKSEIAGGIVKIVGVDDDARKPYKYVEIPENILLSGFQKNLLTVLLKHKPLVDQAAIGLFDLQLSGHTHKGQIFPFNFITKLFFPLHSGYYKLSDASGLYVNRGLGTWGPPVRFLAPPEITVVEIIYASK